MVFNRFSILVFLFAASIAAETCQPYTQMVSYTSAQCGDTFTTRLQNNILTVFSVQPPCKQEVASLSLSFFLDSPISFSDITSLEYNIRWNQPMTNCTFGIGDKTGFFLNMTDQLGLTNLPNEDLKGFSNGWYERRFVLDQQTLNLSGRSSLRFGFICSRTASNATIYRNVDFNRIRVFRGESDKVGLDLMDPLQACTVCSQPVPALGMQCQMDNTVYRWVQTGDLRKSTLEIPFSSNVRVIGDIYSDYIYIYDYGQLNMTGCLKNMDGSDNYPIIVYLSGYYHTNNSLTIYTGSNCPLPNIRIASAKSMIRCPDFFSGNYYPSGSNEITFEWTRQLNEECWEHDENGVEWQLILVIVLPCCALIAGVIIAIVFGVRKHKKRQMERKEKLEEMTRSGFAIDPKNDIEK